MLESLGLGGRLEGAEKCPCGVHSIQYALCECQLAFAREASGEVSGVDSGLDSVDDRGRCLVESKSISKYK